MTGGAGRLLALMAGHDVGYIAPTGALHAIGAVGGAPQIPVNMLGDFGGGSLYLAVGLLAALHEAKISGRGQVVDAAIVDGTAHLTTMLHGLLDAGLWRDERGVNSLDGGAPYYSTYRTSDGEYMAVGALEPAFFAALLLGLDIPADEVVQTDQTAWPALRTRMAEAFARRTQEDGPRSSRRRTPASRPYSGFGTLLGIRILLPVIRTSRAAAWFNPPQHPASSRTRGCARRPPAPQASTRTRFSPTGWELRATAARATLGV